MSNSILYRTAEFESSGRTVYGTAVPFGEVIEVDDGQGPFREMFEQGAFARTIVERGTKVKLLTQHDRQKLAIGKASVLREEAAGLYAEFDVAATRDGDEALELVRSGTVDSFSIGFRVIREHRQRGVRVVAEASLWEVSLVNFPAYSNALVGGVRAQSHLLIPKAVAERRLTLLDL